MSKLNDDVYGVDLAISVEAVNHITELIHVLNRGQDQDVVHELFSFFSYCAIKALQDIGADKNRLNAFMYVLILTAKEKIYNFDSSKWMDFTNQRYLQYFQMIDGKSISYGNAALCASESLYLSERFEDRPRETYPELVSSYMGLTTLVWNMEKYGDKVQ